MKYTPTNLHWQQEKPPDSLNITAHYGACGTILTGMNTTFFWSWRAAQQLLRKHPDNFTLCPKCEEIHAQKNSDYYDGLSKE